jgi:hypothetical protein
VQDGRLARAGKMVMFGLILRRHLARLDRQGPEL